MRNSPSPTQACCRESAFVCTYNLSCISDPVFQSHEHWRHGCLDNKIVEHQHRSNTPTLRRLQICAALTLHNLQLWCTTDSNTRKLIAELEWTLRLMYDTTSHFCAGDAQSDFAYHPMTKASHKTWRAPTDTLELQHDESTISFCWRATTSQA